MKTIYGPGTKQGQVTCTQDTWVELAAANQNRSYLHVQNLGTGTLYLYQGPTAPAAVDGSVGFHALRTAGAGQAYDEFMSGDDEATMRGCIWGLSLGAESTAQVGEF
jgi:hypothetical protein